MPPTLLERATQRLPRAYRQDASDVFCCVRHYLGDEELSQPPLLVWPGDDNGKNRAFWGAAARDPGERFSIILNALKNC